MIAYGLYFSDAKDLGEISMASPPTRAPDTHGMEKIATFNK